MTANSKSQFAEGTTPTPIRPINPTHFRIITYTTQRLTADHITPINIHNCRDLQWTICYSKHILYRLIGPAKRLLS